MKRSRQIAFATLFTLLLAGIVPADSPEAQAAAPAAYAAAPGSSKATSSSQAPLVRGFIVRAEGKSLLGTPKFPVSGRFAATKLNWSQGLGGFGRTLELAEPVSAATASKMLAELKSALGTDAIYPDREYQLLETETQTGPTWGIDRIDQRALPLTGTYDFGSNGEGVDVYVMDTGIRASHNDFGGRVEAGWTAYLGDSATLDCHGHGTHVAGTVGGATYGVAKAATLIPLKVFSCEGDGAYTSDIVAGINWMMGQHNSSTPAVLNMSLGGAGEDTLMNAAIRTAVADGITVAVASGNSGDNACLYSPAMEPAAITVNASTPSDDDASYSNYGSCTDIYAPGSSVLSASHANNSGSATMSGTSMASPHVAGAAARILSEHPDYTPADVWAEMSSQATPVDWYYTSSDAKILLYLDPVSANLTLTDIPLAPTPTITGNSTVGETLTANAGTWTLDTSLEYQWLRGTSEIAGATAASYSLVSADAAQRISVRVTGTLDGYLETSRTSAQTATVLVGFSLASVPTITGSPMPDQTLRVSTGSWSPKPSFKYQWYCDGVAISRATGSSLKLTSAHNGCLITVSLLASARGLSTVSKLSEAVGPVELIELAFTSAPTPTVTGNVIQGSTLRVTTGSWSPKPKLTYQWLKNGLAITRATKNSYKLTSADVGSRISVRVTATGTGYTTTSRESLATIAVQPKSR